MFQLESTKMNRSKVDFKFFFFKINFTHFVCIIDQQKHMIIYMHTIYIHKTLFYLAKIYSIKNYAIWYFVSLFFSFLNQIFGINTKFRIFYEVLRWVKVRILIWERYASSFFLINWEALRNYWNFLEFFCIIHKKIKEHIQYFEWMITIGKTNFALKFRNLKWLERLPLKNLVLQCLKIAFVFNIF